MLFLVLGLVVLVLSAGRIPFLPIGFVLSNENLTVPGLVGVVGPMLFTIVFALVLVGVRWFGLMLLSFPAGTFVFGRVVIGFKTSALMVSDGEFMLRFGAFADFDELLDRRGLRIKTMISHKFFMALGRFGSENVHHVRVWHYLCRVEVWWEFFELLVQGVNCSDALPGVNTFGLRHLMPYVSSLVF